MIVTYLDLLDVSWIENGIDGIPALAIDLKVQILIVATRTLWIKLAFCYIVDGPSSFFNYSFLTEWKCVLKTCKKRERGDS